MNIELEQNLSNYHCSELNNSPTKIDLLRRKHLKICSIVELHDSVYKTPIGIIFTVFIVQTCIALYSLTDGASLLIEFGTFFSHLGYGTVSVAISIACGIILNKSVS